MKTDPNLCPPPAPESGDGRRPSDRPSPVTALGGTASPSRTTEATPTPGWAERRSALHAVRWEERPTRDGSGEYPARPEYSARSEYPARPEGDLAEDLTPSTSGEFDPYRFGSHMLPYEFLQDALKEPLRAPRDEDLLHETLPPFTPGAVSTPPVVMEPEVPIDPKKTLGKGLRLSPEQAAFLRGSARKGASDAEGGSPTGARRVARGTAWFLLLGAGVLSLALGIGMGKWERTQKEERARSERLTQDATRAPGGVAAPVTAATEGVAAHAAAPLKGVAPEVEPVEQMDVVEGAPSELEEHPQPGEGALDVHPAKPPGPSQELRRRESAGSLARSKELEAPLGAQVTSDESAKVEPKDVAGEGANPSRDLTKRGLSLGRE